MIVVIMLCHCHVLHNTGSCTVSLVSAGVAFMAMGQIHVCISCTLGL